MSCWCLFWSFSCFSLSAAIFSASSSENASVFLSASALLAVLARELLQKNDMTQMRTEDKYISHGAQ